MIDKLKIYWDHGLLREGCGVDVSQEDLGNLKSWLRPHHIEVGTELNAVFLNKISIIEFSAQKWRNNDPRIYTEELNVKIRII